MFKWILLGIAIGLFCVAPELSLIILSLFGILTMIVGGTFLIWIGLLFVSCLTAIGLTFLLLKDKKEKGQCFFTAAIVGLAISCMPMNTVNIIIKESKLMKEGIKAAVAKVEKSSTSLKTSTGRTVGSEYYIYSWFYQGQEYRNRIDKHLYNGQRHVVFLPQSPEKDSVLGNPSYFRFENFYIYILTILGILFSVIYLLDKIKTFKGLLELKNKVSNKPA